MAKPIGKRPKSAKPKRTVAKVTASLKAKQGISKQTAGRDSTPARAVKPSANGSIAIAKTATPKSTPSRTAVAKSANPKSAKARTASAQRSRPSAPATTRRATLPRVARSSITAPGTPMPPDRQPKETASSTLPHVTARAVPPSPQTAPRPMSKAKRQDPATITLPDDYRPSDAEPFMSPAQRAYFKRKLSTWKDEIIRETMETLQVLHDDTAQHPDLADRATSESDRALELRARDRQRKLIAKIDAALKRIEDGSYGYCMESGEPIGLRRLDARPIATLSLEAQERHERRERIHRDD
jgi:DnaK suppressor protein